MTTTGYIYSATEANQSDDFAGFWNNEDGWTTLDQATLVEQGCNHGLTDDATFVTKAEAARILGQLTGLNKVQLVLDVSYDLNGVDINYLRQHLEASIRAAIETGALSGYTEATVDDYSLSCMVVEPLEKDLIADYFEDRLENCAINVNDLPCLMASLGLQNPVEFMKDIAEKREELEMND